MRCANNIRRKIFKSRVNLKSKNLPLTSELLKVEAKSLNEIVKETRRFCIW